MQHCATTGNNVGPNNVGSCCELCTGFLLQQRSRANANLNKNIILNIASVLVLPLKYTRNDELIYTEYKIMYTDVT